MRTIRILLILVSALALTGASFADDLKAIQRVIQSNYKQMDRAYQTKDLPTIVKMFSPTCKFKMNGEGQSVTTPIFLHGTEALFKSKKSMKSTTKLNKFKKAKNGGYLAITTWTGKTVESKRDKAGKLVSTTSGTVQTVYDTWMKTPQGWRIVNRLIEQ